MHSNADRSHTATGPMHARGAQKHFFSWQFYRGEKPGAWAWFCHDTELWSCCQDWTELPVHFHEEVSAFAQNHKALSWCTTLQMLWRERGRWLQIIIWQLHPRSVVYTRLTRMAGIRNLTNTAGHATCECVTSFSCVWVSTVVGSYIW